MQSLPAATQFEIGLDSMSSVLSKISLGTSEGNSFLSIIEKDIYNLKNDIEMVLFKSLTFHSKSKDILGNILFTVTESNFVLTDILTLLQNSVAVDNKRIKAENNWKEKLYNTFLNQDSLSTVNEGYSKIDNFLESIDKNVSNIFKKLSGETTDKIH
jgi:archaellum component FlaC